MALPVLLFLPLFLGAAELELSAEADRTTVALGDRVLLTVTATGTKVDGLPRPSLPWMADFKLVSTIWSRFGNEPETDSGPARQTVGFIYTLEPSRTGDLTIPAATLVYNKATYKTGPIAVKVVPAGESVPPVQSWAEANGVELVGTIDRSSVFVGEQVQVTYRLFSRTRVGGAVMKDVPPFEGFWAAEVNDTNDLTWEPTMHGGEPCSVAVVRRATLFPLQPGGLVVGRMTLAGVVAVAGGLFSGMQTPFTVSSAPLIITVRPLPDSGRPADFAGGVGKFDLSADLSGNQTRNGEPLNLEVRVSGTGNIGTIGEPQVHVASGVQLLAPEPDQQVSTVSGRVQGVRTYSYSMIPRADGLNIVPATSMSFFDPTGDTYYTRKTGNETFVATGVLGGGVSLEHGPQAELRGADILRIKSYYSRVAPAAANPYWSRLLYSLGVLVLFTGVFVGRHRRRLESDRGYALRSRAGRLLRKRLRESARLLAAGDEDGCYAALSLAVVGYAGDRFNVDVAGLTGPELFSALCGRGAEPAVAERVRDFSSRCDLARFSPEAAGFSPEAALDRVYDIVRSL